MKFRQFRSLTWRSGTGRTPVNDTERAIFKVRTSFFGETGHSLSYERAHAYVTLHRQDEDAAQRYLQNLKDLTISFPPTVKTATQK